jgi:membrane carboxypeptidase/penicillin-binding protein
MKDFFLRAEALSLSDSEMEKRFGETLSFGLGAYEISPLESAVLNSLLVNGGNFIIPYGIRNVKDYHGNLIWDNEKEVIEKINTERGKTELSCLRQPVV